MAVHFTWNFTGQKTDFGSVSLNHCLSLTHTMVNTIFVLSMAVERKFVTKVDSTTMNFDLMIRINPISDKKIHLI